MNTGFRDHFAPVAAAYAAYRPAYPPELFAWLAAQAPGRDLAWDCGAGSGQASVALAAHFAHVCATDASAAQIAGAPPHPGVTYRVAPAERSGLRDASCDAVAVAQALHWFDLPAFYREVRRVLRPGGVLAAWTYGVQRVEGGAVDALVQEFYTDVVGPYWPPERRHVESGYRTLDFPFEEIAAPPFAMAARWNLDQLLGYLGSWSATARCLAAQGHDPVAALRTRLAPLWGDPQNERGVTWPLSVRAGRP